MTRDTRESAGPGKEPPRKLLLGLIADVRGFNAEHAYNMRSMFTRIITGATFTPTPEEAQAAAAETFHSIHADLSKLRMAHDDALATLGINVVFHSTDENSPVRASVHVVKPKRFVTGLRQFGSELDTTGRALLAGMIHDLEDQIRGMDFEKLTATDKKVLENLPAIVEALKEADSETATEKLAAFSRFQKKNTLGNYIAVEREGLWIEKGSGRGPATWANDTTPERLRVLWAKAVGIVRTQEKKGAKGVGGELKEHLFKCLAKATEDLPNLSWSEEQKAALGKVLSEASAALTRNERKN